MVLPSFVMLIVAYGVVMKNAQNSVEMYELLRDEYLRDILVHILLIFKQKS